MKMLYEIDKYDNQYLAYLLYDLLSNDSNGTIDTQEQTILFDSASRLRAGTGGRARVCRVRQCHRQEIRIRRRNLPVAGWVGDRLREHLRRGT